MKKKELKELIRKTVRETLYVGPGAVPPAKKDPNFAKVTDPMDKTDIEKKLRAGGSVQLEGAEEQWAVERLNGQVVKYFGSQKDAQNWISDNDSDGMIDFNIRRVDSVEEGVLDIDGSGTDFKDYDSVYERMQKLIKYKG